MIIKLQSATRLPLTDHHPQQQQATKTDLLSF